MTVFIALLATVLGLVASAVLYLGAPSQRLLVRRLAMPVSLGAGAVLTVLSLTLFLQVSGPAASVFILTTLIMSAWSGLPFLMAAVKPGRSRRT